MKKNIDSLQNMKRLNRPKININVREKEKGETKNKITNWTLRHKYFLQRGLTITLFVLAVGFGTNYLVHSSSNITTIGENISTHNLTASGVIKEGGTALSQKYISIPEGPAKGDMLYYDGTGWVKLTPGASGYYLKTQGANNNPVWATINYTETDPLSVHTETDPLSIHEPTSPAQGDIIYYNGSNWTKLTAGTSGYFLKTQGASANPLWAEVSFTETDPLSIHTPGSSAQGDILYHNGTTWTKLAAGNSGEFLKTQGVSADPLWAEAGGKTATTFVIADADTSNNTTRADYVVPSGSTSAETTINQAITDLPTNGGSIYLLEGTYDIDGSISINKSNVSLIGSGKGTKITTNANITMVDISSYKTGVLIKNLYLFGSEGNVNKGIYIYYGTYNIVSDCWIEDCNPGIELRNGSKNIIKGNHITSCITNGAIWINEDTNNIIIGNNLVSNSKGVYCCDSSNNNLISNNNIVSNTSSGIELYGDYNNIIGNYFQGNSSLGMKLIMGASYNKVTGNHFYSNTGQGIWISGMSGSKSDSNLISGNIIRDNSTYGIYIAERYADNNVIKDNLLNGNTSGPIDYVQYATANNNTIIRANIGYNPVGVVSTPFDNTNHQIRLGGDAAGPTAASTDYEVLNIPCRVISTGGTGVDITIKDAGGNTITSPGATCDEWLEIGWKINFGGFSAASTVTTAFK